MKPSVKYICVAVRSSRPAHPAVRRHAALPRGRDVLGPTLPPGLGGVDHIPAGPPLYRRESIFLPQHFLYSDDQAESSPRQRADQLQEGGEGLLRPRPSIWSPVVDNLLQVRPCLACLAPSTQNGPPWWW